MAVEGSRQRVPALARWFYMNGVEFGRESVSATGGSGKTLQQPVQQLRFLPVFMGSFKFRYLVTCRSPLLAP